MAGKRGARRGGAGTKDAVVAVQGFDTTLAGWLFDAQCMAGLGQPAWRWSNANEADFLRPNDVGYLLFRNVPVSANSLFQLLAAPPGSRQVQHRPIAPCAPLNQVRILFKLTLRDFQNQNQVTRSFSRANTGPTSSSTVTPSFKFSGTILGTGAEAGSSAAKTETGPSSTDTSVTGTTETTTSIQVRDLTLTRVLHLDGIAGLTLPPMTAFG